MNTPPDTEIQKPRMEYWKAAPEVIKSMLAMESAVRNSGLDPILQELIKLRISQINGCAYCADMHFKDAKKIGESDERLNLLAFWHEVDLFTAQEKAALHWVEKLTRLPGGPVSDEDFALHQRHHLRLRGRQAQGYLRGPQSAQAGGCAVVMSGRARGHQPIQPTSHWIP